MRKFAICCILAATLILLCSCNKVARATYAKSTDSVYTSAYIQMRHAFAQHEGVEDEAVEFGNLPAKEVTNIENGHGIVGEEMITVYLYSIKGKGDEYFGTNSYTVWDIEEDILPPAGAFPIKDNLLVYGVNGQAVTLHEPSSKEVNRIADELGYKMNEVKSIIDSRFKE